MSIRSKVLVSRKTHHEAIHLLTEHCLVDYNTEDRPLTAAELAARVADCDGLLCLPHDKIDELLLTAAPKLKVVSNVAVGYDNFDLAAMARHRVMGTNTPGVLTDTTADFAFALLMSAARRVAEADRYVRAGKFTSWSVDLMLGRDVHHATLGILGMGRIGQAMARRARGFDMRVIYHDDVRVQPEVERELALQFLDMDTVIRDADFLSLHVPLLPTTRHLIGERELKLMKRSAVLVNTSRGPVVDEAALIEAVRNGVIAATALDVYEFEPKIPAGLMSLENVVLAPHIGSASVVTRTRMAVMAAENCIAALEGRAPPNLVTPK